MLDETAELGAGRLEGQHVADTADDPRSVVRACDRGQALLRSALHERVVVMLAAYRDARPGGFLDVHTGPVHGSELAHEVQPQPAAEVCDPTDELAGNGE